MIKDTEDFIRQAKEVHGERYDYSKTTFVSTTVKVIIICRKHGQFKQLPYNHLRGQNCLACSGKQKLTNEVFIERGNKIHNNFYDYSKVDYKGIVTPVEIICPKHGIFWQKPLIHLGGSTCPNCYKERKRVSREEFIERATKIFENFYDYSNVEEFCKLTDTVTIICPIHGKFRQKCSIHLLHKGCPTCAKLSKRSKGEKELCKFIKSIYPGKVLENDRTVIKPKELDIYLPELKLAFEYNGEYYHSVNEERMPGYHQSKEASCREANIKLVTIWELNDWKGNNKATKEMIASIIQSRKAYAKLEK